MLCCKWSWLKKEHVCSEIVHSFLVSRQLSFWWKNKLCLHLQQALFIINILLFSLWCKYKPKMFPWQLSIRHTKFYLSKYNIAFETSENTGFKWYKNLFRTLQLHVYTYVIINTHIFLSCSCLWVSDLCRDVQTDTSCLLLCFIAGPCSVSTCSDHIV